MWSWESFLSNFPTFLTLWSALTLSWGAFATVTYYKLVRYTVSYNCEHVCYNANVVTMIIANCFIFGYLIFGSWLTHNVGDAIAVINIFYTVYLIPLTVCIYKSWRCKLDLLQETEYTIKNP